MRFCSLPTRRTESNSPGCQDENKISLKITDRKYRATISIVSIVSLQTEKIRFEIIEYSEIRSFFDVVVTRKIDIVCGHYVGSRRRVIIIVDFPLSDRANTTATHVYVLSDAFGKPSYWSRLPYSHRFSKSEPFSPGPLASVRVEFVSALGRFAVRQTMAKKGLKRKQKTEPIKEEEPKVAALPLVRRSDEPVAKKVNSATFHRQPLLSLTDASGAHSGFLFGGT